MKPRFDCHRSGCSRSAMTPSEYRNHIETHTRTDARRRRKREADGE